MLGLGEEFLRSLAKVAEANGYTAKCSEYTCRVEGRGAWMEVTVNRHAPSNYVDFFIKAGTVDGGAAAIGRCLGLPLSTVGIYCAIEKSANNPLLNTILGLVDLAYADLKKRYLLAA